MPDTDGQIAEYYRVMADAAHRFTGAPHTSEALHSLQMTLKMVQRDFLAAHPDIVALREITFSMNGGSVSIDAPVVPAYEKFRIDFDERKREKLLQELQAQQEAQDRISARREASMLRHHRRLLGRYKAALPDATRGIWDTLEVWQQYAILKDLDYAKRHTMDEGIGP